MTDTPTPGTPADWLEDPTGRHQWRYWDGTEWTENVANDGVASIDPYEEPSGTTGLQHPVAPSTAEPSQPPAHAAHGGVGTESGTRDAPIGAPSDAGAVIEPPPPVPSFAGRDTDFSHVAAPAPPPISEAFPPAFPHPSGPQGQGPSASRRPLVIIGVLAAVALLVVLFLVFTGDDGDDDEGASPGDGNGQPASGECEEIDSDVEVVLEVPASGLVCRTVQLDADQLLLVAAVPMNDEDVILGVAVDPDADGASEFSDFIGREVGNDLFSDNGEIPGELLYAGDFESGGTEEKQIVPAPTDLEVRIIVGGYRGEGGTVTLELEVVELDIPENVEDVQEAVCEEPRVEDFDPDLCAADSGSS